MRIAIERAERSMRARSTWFVCALAATVGLCAAGFAGSADAATASPGWQLLAGTGPTNLPPKQSEVQRVIVEGEAGTFTLGEQTGEGQGTLSYGEGYLKFVEGSDEASLSFGKGGFEVGQAVVSGATGVVPLGTEVLEVKDEGKLLVLSASAAKKATSLTHAAGRTISGVSGDFHVGDAIAGEHIPAGAVVTAVGVEAITISEYPTAAGAVELKASESTQPVAYDAAAEALQSALEAMPALGAGSVSVSGGPGGDAAHPYLIESTGPLADKNVPQLAGSSEGLGAHGSVHVMTVLPGGPGTGEIAIFATNLGAVSTSGLTTLKLGPLPAEVVISGEASGGGWSCITEAAGQSLTCTSTAGLQPLSDSPSIRVPVEVRQSGESHSSVTVSVEGGGGAKVSKQIPITISSTPAQAGIEAFWAGAYGEDGAPFTQAGGHPYSAATAFLLNSVRVPNGRVVPAGDLKDTLFDLPPGFAGNPLITQRCSQSVPAETFNSSPACTRQQQGVGFLEPFVGSFGAPFVGFPIFNDVPVGGSAAEFTTRVVAPVQSLVGSVRSEEDYGIRISAPHAAPFDKLFGAYTVLDGRPEAAHGKAFLDNPSDCSQQRAEAAEGRGPAIRIAVNTWQHSDIYSHAEERPPLLTGCQALTEAFTGEGPDPGTEEPTFTFAPSSVQGSSPVGATAHLHIPQEGLSPDEKPGEAEELATSDLKKAVVVLPEGLSVNPSSANGLEACSEQQIGYLGSGFPSPAPIRFSEAAPSCPDASKLGSFEISTPLLEEALEGTIYLAAQDENPFHSLIALYLVVDSERFGITLKLAGEVRPDPSTGQLTATFDDNPQLPFEDLTLHFRGGGGRSELATPEVCGHYATTGALTPWSAEHGEAALIEEEGFTVSGGCSVSAAGRPFVPGFEAGTVAPSAGVFSPLVVRLSRRDGEQELTHFDLTLPEGLLGRLAGVGRCSDAAIAVAGSVSGREELAKPSCPESSLLGTVDAAAGVGSEPLHVPGRIYLAGAYEGGPYSVVVITPAVAGPFDLGDVVVRAPLFIDRSTARVTARSDAIPTILDGIPLKVRQIAIDIDRPGFTLNPTSCQVMSVTGSATGSSGASSALASRFQVGGCEGLSFKPVFQASTSSKTSRKKGASLTVKLEFPAGGQANLARAKVQLPLQLPSRLATLKQACTEEQFAKDPAGCPRASVVGSATAVTPILASPLTGPAYFVSHGGAKFPELVLVLQGEGITIQLDGETFIAKGITTSTFDQVPDAPVSSFTLSLPTGEDSALAAPGGHLCRDRLIMPTTLTAQNGMVLRQNTRIHVQGCPDRLQVVSQRLRHRTLTLRVAVPAAGKLRAKGKGLAAKTKTATGAETLTLKLKERGRPAPKTKIALAFTPSSGKTRKQLKANITIEHKH